MCSVTVAEEGPRGQDVKWRTPTARVRKTGDLQSARARQAEGEEGGWLKTRNREKRPLLHQKVGSVNVSREQELIRDWTWCKRHPVPFPHSFAVQSTCGLVPVRFSSQRSKLEVHPRQQSLMLNHTWAAWLLFSSSVYFNQEGFDIFLQLSRKLETTEDAAALVPSHRCDVPPRWTELGLEMKITLVPLCCSCEGISSQQRERNTDTPKRTTLPLALFLHFPH